jgi:hypothetical protein
MTLYIYATRITLTDCFLSETHQNAWNDDAMLLLQTMMACDQLLGSIWTELDDLLKYLTHVQCICIYNLYNETTVPSITFTTEEDEMFCIFQIKKCRVLRKQTAEYT